MKTLFTLALAAVAIALAGCETESSDNISITVSPSHAEIKKGESVTFTASGWRDYTWSLADSSAGVLSVTKGDSTVYTAVKGPTSTNDADQTHIVVVSVNIAGDGVNSTTNTAALSTSDLVSAQALINVTY